MSSLEYTQGQLGDLFNEWLYNRFPIGNGHMLVAKLEDHEVWDEFLADKGLPIDLEMEF